jgi:cytochrome P450
VIGKGKKQFTLKKDQAFYISIMDIHNDPDIWQQPDEFIPDRFNPDSKFYLQPNGQARDTLAFNPFFGGKRICLGKTFAESVFRFTLPMIYYHVDLEFVDHHK